MGSDRDLESGPGPSRKTLEAAFSTRFERDPVREARRAVRKLAGRTAGFQNHEIDAGGGNMVKVIGVVK
jgi:hypothetical protein